MSKTTNPCTDCRDNFPPPSGPLDFFDSRVVADYVTRRTACTKCPANAKPCLQPAPAKPLPQAQPKATPTTFSSIPHADAFEALDRSHGLVLPAPEVARLMAALEGAQAVTALFQQREIDQDSGNGEGVTFGPRVAIGLASALASCTALAQTIVETGGLTGERAEHGSKAYEVLKGARFDVMDAKRKGGNQ